MYDIRLLKRNEIPHIDSKIYPELQEISRNFKIKDKCVTVLDVSTLIPVSRHGVDFLVPLRMRNEYLCDSAEGRDKAIKRVRLDCERLIDKWIAPGENELNNTKGQIRLYKYID